MSDSPILSYYDSLLRQSDVSLLEPPNWLNDQIIGFAFEYFQREKFGNNKKMYFIEPAVTQMIKLCPEPYEIQGQILLITKNIFVVSASVGFQWG
jgi:sentrin-specific protease 8